jgi:hypothetical protein
MLELEGGGGGGGGAGGGWSRKPKNFCQGGVCARSPQLELAAVLQRMRMCCSAEQQQAFKAQRMHWGSKLGAVIYCPLSAAATER